MKFGQLIEYITWEIFFLKNHTQNAVELSFPDLFAKFFCKNWANLCINSLNFMQFVFTVSQVENYQNMWCADHMLLPRFFKYVRPFYNIVYERVKLLLLFFFLKKGSLELVSLPHFLHDFWRKIFLLLYSTAWPNFMAFNKWDIGQYVYCTCLLTRLWRHRF